MPSSDLLPLKHSLALACRWLTDVAMVQHDSVTPEVNRWQYDFSSWQGAMLEYDAGEHQWYAYGPMWHTGQAVKALVLAYRVLGDRALLEGARKGASFVLRERINGTTDPDYGALLSYEGDEGPGAHVGNISGMLETLDGLLHLGQETGEADYREAAVACLRWVARRAYLPHEGLFHDRFSLKDRSVGPLAHIQAKGLLGRPLLDDGVFLRGFKLTINALFRDVFFQTADRLLKDESPPGNWITYPPANSEAGTLHPRHAYWWGRPLIMAWKESGDPRYLECAKRSADWYMSAQRRDGGLFRTTYTDFSTSSFGHATSGIMCAAILWHDLIVEGRGDAYREPLRRALAYSQSMQFSSVSDANLLGAVLEKVRPPQGNDKLPYVVRDLATIFYVQALSVAILDALL